MVRTKESLKIGHPLTLNVGCTYSQFSWSILVVNFFSEASRFNAWRFQRAEAVATWVRVSKCWHHLPGANVQASAPLSEAAGHPAHAECGATRGAGSWGEEEDQWKPKQEIWRHLSLFSLRWPEVFERVSSDKSSDLSLAIVDSAVGKQREGEQRGVTGERRREGKEGRRGGKINSH